MKASWSHNRVPPAAGLTFIEIMVALCILAISLTVLMHSQGRSVDLGAKANSADTAAFLAQMKMEEIQLEAQRKGIDSVREEERGEFDRDLFPGYRWEYRLSAVALPLVGATGGTQESQMKMIQGFLEKAIRQVNLKVIWQDAGREKEFELVTHLVKLDFLSQLASAFGGAGGGKP